MVQLSLKQRIFAKFKARAPFCWELTGAVVFVYLCFNIPDNFKSLYFHTFMRRDMDRALELLKGHLIFFGPEASGGGYLPGPLIYFMLAGALLFSPFWQSCFWLLINLFLGMAVAGWLWFRQRFGVVGGFLLLALLAISHPVRSYVLLFLNVSYMLPFAFFAILTTCVAFSDELEKKRDRYILITAALVGLGMQLHFSIVCVLLAAVFMFSFHKRLGLERPSRRAMWLGLLVIGLCSLPFIVWSGLGALGIHFGQQGTFVGEAPGSFQTLIMLANYSLDQPLWITVREGLLRLFAITPITLGLAIGVFLLNQGWEIFGHAQVLDLGLGKTEQKDFRALLWLTFWSFFPFSYVFLVHMGRRYSMVYCFCLIFITLRLQVRLLRHQRTAFLMAFVSGLAALGLAYFYYSLSPRGLHTALERLLLALVPLPFIYGSVRKKYAHRLSVLLGVVFTVFILILQFNVVAPRGLRVKEVPRYHHSDWLRIWNYVYSSTGWDYQTAMRRTYFVNLRLDEDPRPIYDDVYRKAGDKNFKVEDPPDGFLILNAKYLVNRRRTPNFVRFLEKQRVPSEILEGIRRGEILLGSARIKGTKVIPYWVKVSSHVPRYFHDVGEGYFRSDETKQVDQVSEAEGILKLAENKYLFKWNECPGHNVFCNTGSVVEFSRESASYIRLKVDVLGSVISQNSPWISPSWTQAWIEPYVELHCGADVHKLILFKSIGMSRDYGTNEYNELLQANNSVIAPFHREYSVRCLTKPDFLAVGRASSTVEKLTKTINLPSKQLSQKL